MATRIVDAHKGMTAHEDGVEVSRLKSTDSEKHDPQELLNALHGDNITAEKHAEIVNRYENEIANMKAQKIDAEKTFQSELESLETEIESSQSNMYSLRKGDKELKMLQPMFEELRAANELLLLENKKLRKKMDTDSTRMLDLKKIVNKQAEHMQKAKVDREKDMVDAQKLLLAEKKIIKLEHSVQELNVDNDCTAKTHSDAVDYYANGIASLKAKSVDAEKAFQSELETLKANIESSETTIVSLKKELRRAAKEQDPLRALLEESRSAGSASESENQRRVSELQKTINEQDKQIKSLRVDQKKSMTDTQKLGLAEERNKELQQSVEELKPLQSMLETASRASVSEQQRLGKKIDADSKTISELLKTIKEQAEQIKSLKVDQGKSMADARKLLLAEEKIKELERFVEELKPAQTLFEKLQLTHRATRLENQSLQMKEETANKKMLDLTKTIHEQAEQIKNLKDDQEKSMVGARKLSLAEEKIKELTKRSTEELKSLQLMLENSRANNRASISEQQRLEKKVDADSKAILELLKATKEQAEEIKGFKGDPKKNMADARKLLLAEEKIKELTKRSAAELKPLQSMLESSRAANRASVSEQQRLEKKIDADSKTISKLQKTIKEQAEQIESLKVDQEENTADAQKLGLTKIKELTKRSAAELKPLQSMLESSRAANRTLLSENQRLQKKEETDSKTILDLKRILNEPEQSKIAYEQDKTNMEAKLIESQKMIEKGEQESKLTDKVRASQMQIKFQLDTSRTANGMLQSEIKNLEKELKLATKEIPNVEIKFKKQLENQKIKFDREMTEMQRELRAFDGIIAEKEAELREFQVEVEMGRKREDRLANAQIELLQGQVEAFNLEDDSDYMRIASTELGDETLRKEIESGNLILSGNDKENIEFLQNQNRYLTNELEQLQLKLDAREDSNDECQSEDVRKQLEEQRAIHESYKDAMETKLGEAGRDVQVYAKELDQLKETLRTKEVSSNETKAKIEARVKDSQAGTKDDASETELAELRSKMKALQKEIESLQEQLAAKDKQIEQLQNEIISVRDELQKLHTTYRSHRLREERTATNNDSTDVEESQNVINEESINQLREQRIVFEKIKSGIEEKLGITQKSLMAKEKEVELFKTELESVRKEVEEYRRVVNGSDASDYYKEKLEEANTEIESLQSDVEKFRAVWAD